MWYENIMHNLFEVIDLSVDVDILIVIKLEIPLFGDLLSTACLYIVLHDIHVKLILY